MHSNYKAFIDSLAALTGKSLTIPYKRRLQELGLEGNPEVEQLLRDMYQSGIHDVAALLEELTDLEKLDLSFEGEKIAGSPYASMNFDLVARIEGDPWPDDAENL